MMRISLVGDTHGKAMDASQFVDGAIQVGDFNLSGYDRWKPLPGRRLAFIDGNHDHFPTLKTSAEAPQEIQPGLFYIPRAWVCGRVMFMGGAESIDAKSRHPGWSIFPEESITQADFRRAFYQDVKIEVFISHTSPEFISKKMIRGGKENQSSEMALSGLWERFRPSLWVFGHFHQPFDQTIQGTRFVCLPIQRSREFDLPLENWPDVLSNQGKESKNTNQLPIGSIADGPIDEADSG